MPCQQRSLCQRSAPIYHHCECSAFPVFNLPLKEPIHCVQCKYKRYCACLSLLSFANTFWFDSSMRRRNSFSSFLTTKYGRSRSISAPRVNSNLHHSAPQPASDQQEKSKKGHRPRSFSEQVSCVGKIFTKENTWPDISIEFLP